MIRKVILMLIPVTTFGLSILSTAPLAQINVSTSSSSTKKPDKKDKGLLGPSCRTNNPDHICLAVKYVSYKNWSDEPVINQTEAEQNIDGINKLWSQCSIGFQIENYVAAMPKDYGLSSDPADTSELTDIRNDFMDRSTLLVVTTGSWNRSGSLGATPANAWTSMPGEDPVGAILEGSVGTFSNIIAHELGHYLNLSHVYDSDDLMNPVIYPSSTAITQDQCSAAREASQEYWKNMIRA